MKIVDNLKKMINRLKSRKQLLLNSPRSLYADFLNKPEIDALINNMPQNLSDMEKAYYIYIELGKIVSENPKIVFSDEDAKEEHYHDKMDDEYYGICKSISELYVRILKDKRVGLSADLVKKHPRSSSGHIDVILKVDGKNYIVNLIGDLSRIKTSRRINNFCFDLSKSNNNPIMQAYNMAYLKRLEHYYGKIDCLTREEIEQFDKKLGYSYVAKFSKKNERGIYTEDVLDLLREDMENPESFKEYVLHNQEVSREDVLKYKLDYVFENINKFTQFNGDMQYLENIRYYLKVSKKLLSAEEASRIQAYAAIVGDDFSNIISILKVKPLNQFENKNRYYLYSKEEKKYIEKSPKEMKQVIHKLDKNSLHIVGTFDRFNPKEMTELELE